ncbi:MAG: gliding motility-associated C-terminal domain-containing protein [Bacteroidota bacterium]
MNCLKHILVAGTFVLCLHNSKAQTAIVYDTNDSISNIIMPNVFTPNFDSINDVYKPYLDEIVELNFSIFNRYGNLIFETTRLNGFWDGRTTSGEPCKDGVYFCILNATGIEGKSYKEKTFVQLFTNGFYNK